MASLKQSSSVASTSTTEESPPAGARLSDDELELHLWQRAYFLDDGSSVRLAVDSLRLRLAHLHYCCEKEQSAGGSTLYMQHLMGDYLREYGRLVDSPTDGDKGLDNFTAAAKVLSTGHRRDWRGWKPTLTVESMMDIPDIQAAVKAERIPDKPLHTVQLPTSTSSESAGSLAPTSSRHETATHVQKSPTSPFGVFSNPPTARQPPQGRTSVHPAASGSCSSSSQPQRHKNTSSFTYSTISSTGASSSSAAVCQRRGKGRAAGEYNDEGRPHTKRARMSTVVDDEDLEDEQAKGGRGRTGAFITARDQHVINQQKKYGKGCGGGAVNSGNYGISKRSLGTRRAAGGKFVPPIKRDQDDGSSFSDDVRSRVLYRGRGNSKGSSDHQNQLPPELEGDERLKNIEPRMVELIMNEIMDHGTAVSWDDIAGLHFAKATIKEIVVWPMMRPDIFKGLRGPPKGILLFGPPGTGKTLIGKCVASQVNATFFSISASSLTSKWIGEGEKMVRALFAVARCHQPAVIFIDEIDSLLSQRSETEHESSRRIKTEFLVQLDGATTSDEDRLLVIGATNRPQEIDEAARRRLVKRLYIPLPDTEARKQIVSNLMRQQPFALSEEETENICKRSEGYSGADMANLCREAAYGPIRESAESIQHIAADEMRPVLFKDFESAFGVIRPSVSEKDLELYIEWNKQFGCGSK